LLGTTAEPKALWPKRLIPFLPWSLAAFGRSHSSTFHSRSSTPSHTTCTSANELPRSSALGRNVRGVGQPLAVATQPFSQCDRIPSALWSAWPVFVKQRRDRVGVSRVAGQRGRRLSYLERRRSKCRTMVQLSDDGPVVGRWFSCRHQLGCWRRQTSIQR